MKNFKTTLLSLLLLIATNTLFSQTYAADDDEVDFYCEILQKFVQKDRGIYISGAPVGCDFEVGEDYSMGKFSKLYGDHV